MNSLSSSETTTSPDRLTLTDYLRLHSRFITDPLAAVLARWGVSPDMLTVIGMLAHFFVAWLLASGQMQWAGIAIFFIAPLDSLDGVLARKIGRPKEGFGAFLDSTMDRIAEIALFAGFILYYAREGDDLMVIITYIALAGSLMVSYIRSKAESLGYSCKVGLLSRVERYVVIVAALVLNRPAYALIILALFTPMTAAQRMFHVWQQVAKHSADA